MNFLKILFGFFVFVIFSPFGILAQDKTIFFEENFDGWTSITAEGWSVINPMGWNFIGVQDDYIDFFKQDPADYMMLISPEIDFTNINLLEFVYKSGSSVENQKLEVGVITDPNDPSTFQVLNIVDVAGYEWISDGANTSFDVITGVGHLAFNISAASPVYTIIDIDNIVLSDEGVALNQPNFISDLEITPADFGSNSATISWTNPALEADGDVLTDLDSVSVYEYGVWLGSVYNPVIGEAAEIQLDVPTAGLYVFTVIAYNSVGPSIAIDNNPPVWIGLDTPSFPENIVLTVTGDHTSNLSWTPPSVGAHGAYFDGEVSAYQIVRADGELFTVDGDVLSFTEDVDIPGTYNYSVSCVNDSGEGSAAPSNTGAYYFDGIILAEDYWVSNPALGWTTEGSSDSIWFYWQTNYAGGNYGESILYPFDEYTGEIKSISPAVSSEGIEALTLRFRHAHFNVAGDYTYRVETTSDGGNTWNEVWSLEVTEDVPGTSELIVIDNEDVGSPNFQIAFVFDGTNTDVELVALDDIWLYEASEVDLNAVSLQIPELIQPNDVVTPTATISNWGYLNTDFTAVLTFSQGGNVVYSSEVTQNIEGGSNLELTFDDWTAAEGSFEAELVINVENDEQPDNNSITDVFNVYILNAERTLVICEEGTGTWCGYCPGAAMGLADLAENGWPVGVLAYHRDDDYSTVEGEERLIYYEVEGYPTVFFDGTTSYSGGSATESLYEDYLPIVQERLAVPAGVAISIENAYFDNNQLHASVMVESGSPIVGDSITLFAQFTESQIPEIWGGLTQLDFVERTIFEGSTGHLIDLSDQTELVDITLDIDPSWVTENSELTVFVQNLDDREIYNGNKIDLISVSIDEVDRWVAVYPNPATDFITIVGCDAALVNVTNMEGKLVLSKNISANFAHLDISNLDFGIYLLELVVDGKRFSKKIMVK